MHIWPVVMNVAPLIFPNAASPSIAQLGKAMENLFVLDGSSFPTSTGVNPTLTMMALAARGCDHLLEQTKGRS